MSKVYARELFVYPSDYDKMCRLNFAPSGENWESFAQLLPQHTGATGFTNNEVQLLRLENPSDPVRVILRAWLPQNTATCYTLCIALRRILADDIVDALGIGAFCPPLMANDLFRTRADFDKLAPLNTAPNGYNWETVAGFLKQENGCQGFTWQQTMQAGRINHADPLGHLMSLWLPQRTATRQVLREAIRKTSNHVVMEKLGLCSIQSMPSVLVWTYDNGPQKTNLVSSISQSNTVTLKAQSPSVSVNQRIVDEQQKENKDDDVCAICFVNKKNSVILDCAHASFCYECVKSFVGKPCPGCNQTVIKVIKTFNI